jgi:deoxyribose-phosphate aldolase
MTTTDPFLTGVYALIDHTDLRTDATAGDIAAAAQIAVGYGCATVCVRPAWVPLAVQVTAGSATGVTTVVGFPSGTALAADKAAETRQAVDAGADEIDMVLNRSLLTAREFPFVYADVAAVRAAAGDRVLKVILESAALTDREVIMACTVAAAAGADFVKTSTGFDPAGGASAHAVRLMRDTVPLLGVKASGGIRTLADIQVMVAAGATRIGMSATAHLDDPAAPGPTGY